VKLIVPFQFFYVQSNIQGYVTFVFIMSTKMSKRMMNNALPTMSSFMHPLHNVTMPSRHDIQMHTVPPSHSMECYLLNTPCVHNWVHRSQIHITWSFLIHIFMLQED